MQQHLPPGHGLLYSKNLSADDQALALLKVTREQIANDRDISKDWTDPVVEKLDSQGHSYVFFKGDVNPFGKSFGRVDPSTRLSLNIGMPYVYSGVVNRGLPMDHPSDIVTFAKEFITYVDEFVKETWPYKDVPLPGPPNNILVNYYSNKDSNIGAHSDKVEPHEDPKTSPVVMISFGASRKWRVIPNSKAVHDKTIEFTTEHGQIAIMYEPMQQFWKHAVPKLKPIPFNGEEDRVSLTFRWLKNVSTEETATEKASRLKRMALY